MQRITFCALLLIVRCVAAGEITSADLKRCPDGHATLKDVPIVYGLMDMDSKALDRHIKNLDFALGGCNVSPESPRVRPTCTTCGFAFDATSHIWGRRSPDRGSFRRPFSSLATSFPKLTHPKSIEYEQWVRGDRVVAEEIVYTASGDHPELKAKIDQWFAAHDIRATYKETNAPPEAEPYALREWKAPGVSIMFSYAPGEFFVWLTHRLQPRKT